MTQALYDHNMAVVRSLTDVVRAVREGASPQVTLEEGARACHVAFAITQAYREGRAVDIPPVDFTIQANGAQDNMVAGGFVRQMTARNH